MTEPGDRRPPSAPAARPRARRASGPDRFRPRSRGVAFTEAAIVGLVAAVAWAFLKGVLEFPGALAVAVVGGWLIGEILWSVRAHPVMAGAVAAAAWATGLVLTWITAMALIPESTRSLIGRLEATPFLDWLSPQFGWIEIAGLVSYVGAALFGARPRSG